MKLPPFSFALAAVLWMAPSLALLAQDQILYNDARQSGWSSWSWAPVRLDSNALVHEGFKAIKVSPAAEEQAFYLHHSAFDSSSYQSLNFWIRASQSGGQTLQVRATLGGKAQAAVPLPPLATQEWQRVSIPLADLGAANQPNLDGFWIQNPKGSSLEAYSVDDISLSALPAPESVHIYVDAGKTVAVIDRRIYGINTAIWDSQLSASATSDILRAMNMQTLRFPGGSASDDYDWQLNRSISGKPHSWPSHSATFARLAEAIGAEAYITANYGSGTPEQAAAWVAYYNASPAATQALGVDAKGRDWKTAGYWAGLRAAAPLVQDDGYNFLRMSHPAPFDFRHWEIGNENYGGWEEDQHGKPGSGLDGAAHDPATYARYFKVFYDQMLAVDPAIKIGAVVLPQGDAPVMVSGTPTAADDRPPGQPGRRRRPESWTPTVLGALRALGVKPHFYIYHYYPQNSGEECDPFALQAGAVLPARAEELRRLVRDGLGLPPEENVELAMTEINSISSDPGKQSTSLVNGLFFADAAAWTARAKFDSSVWWDLRNGPVAKSNHSDLLYGRLAFGDYGVTANRSSGNRAATLYPTFYAGKLLAKWGRGGDALLETITDYPLLSAHAARLADGSLALLVVNKHPATDLKAEVALGDFVPFSRSATIYQYGKQNDLEGADLTKIELNDISSTFSHVFPAYSMSVLVLH